MSGVISAIAIASMVSVALTDVIKNLLPNWVNSKGKTVVAVVLEVVFGAIAGLICETGNALSTIVRVVVVAGLTIAVSQIGYNYILKFLQALIEKLKAKKTE